MINEYDPNNSFVVNKVQLVFMQWGYSLTVISTVRGNIKGHRVLESAIENFLDNLVDDQIILVKPEEDGVDELEITIEDYDELKDICVSASIISCEGTK